MYRSAAAPIRAEAAFLAGLLLLVCCARASSQDVESDRALALYDEGRFAEARPLLEELAAAGSDDGKLLYRLFYCQDQAGDPAARSTLERARERLQAEFDDAGADLEASFFLVNANERLGRREDARRIAIETTGRVEAGQLPEPGAAVDRFRLGKLYVDRGDEVQAELWLSAALDSNDASSMPDAYRVWASRRLAQRALAAGEFATAARHFRGYLVDIRTGDTQDWDGLARALVAIGSYAEAAQAWAFAEQLWDGDRYQLRYSAALAERAAELGSLVSTAPDGRVWSALREDELKRVMGEQARVAQLAMREYLSSEEIDPDVCVALKRRLQQAKRGFVPAALEYALRGHPIREAALSGGYPLLIFGSRSWELPDC